MRAAGKSASVQALMIAAQKAMRATSTIADELGVSWREPDNYDDWDFVANRIVEGFVLEAIRSSNGWTDLLPFVAYDRRISDYSGLSFVVVEDGGKSLPLVCLETAANPFDTCLLAELQPDLKLARYTKRPFNVCQFLAVGRTRSGQDIAAEMLAW